MPREASRDTENAPPAEAFHGGPRARRNSRQGAETSCARLKVEAGGLVGSVVAGEGPTAYLLVLFFDGT